ncbi:hypothetical protein EVJ58_g4555 [Rhodofomes roseus]|uniref:Extracellular membrane protein CFEM domain-containing protein n=1 Tax=Rhodofomes roseus TaxID=34475 RepID=A0A4Y9YGW8_9APHY|nr:hypothetical protein EVJ58_g4555 [Rhodofomes roseus]
MFSTLPSSLLLAVSAALSFVQVGAQSTSGSTTVQVTISGSSSFGTTVPPSSSASANGSGSLSGSATSTASLPSFSGYSACVDNCIDSAVAFTGCSSVADVDCFCGGTKCVLRYSSHPFPIDELDSSTAFAQNLTSCMANYCPSSIGSAESLANQFCAVASPSTSISFATTSLPSTTSASATNTSSSASRSASRSATSSSTSASATTSTSAGMRLGADSKVVVTMAAGLVMAALGVLSAL